MNLSEVQDVVFTVFKDYRVILCAVAVILYLDFISYIVTYHKKPPRIKNKKKAAASASPAAAPAGEQAEENTEAAASSAGAKK